MIAGGLLLAKADVAAVLSAGVAAVLSAGVAAASTARVRLWSAERRLGSGRQ